MQLWYDLDVMPEAPATAAAGINDSREDARPVRYWVIGDIHGMLDPLQRLLDVIECNRVEAHETFRERLIFLGDYIDYGPNSRGVLDAMLRLGTPYEPIFLAGNHEHLMLHFLDQTEFNRQFKTPWMHGNGGGATLLSLCPEIAHPLEVLRGEAHHLIPGECPIPASYTEFLRSLRFAYRDTLPGGLDLVFLHAPPTPVQRTLGSDDIPLEEQLSADTYERFEALVERHRLWIEDTQLWNRRLPPVPSTPGRRLMFHGHTPTHIILEEQSYQGQRAEGFPGEGALPYLHMRLRDAPHYDEAMRLLTFASPLRDLISVHLDTGCAYGIGLTALCFTEAMLTDRDIPGFEIYRARTDLMRSPRDALLPHRVVFAVDD